MDGHWSSADEVWMMEDDDNDDMDGHQLKRSAKEPEAKRAPDGDGDPGFALGLHHHRPPLDGDDGVHDDDEAPPPPSTST